MISESNLRKFTVILFLGLACSVLITAGNYWLNIFSSRHGLVTESGLPVGGDFFAFYNAGILLKNEPSRLYDFDRQWQIQKEEFKDSPSIASAPLPFVYPPVVALPFKYLSSFELPTAFRIWSMFGFFLYGVSVWVVSSSILKNRLEQLASTVIGLGFSPFVALSNLSGHASFLGVFILAMVFLALKTERIFWAGAALSLTYYKPPLFLILLLYLLAYRDWRLFAGFFLGGLFLIIGSVELVGLSTFSAYLEVLPGYRYGAEINPGLVFVPKQGAGLLAAVTTALPGRFALARTVYFFIALAIILFLLRTFTRAKFKKLSFNFQYSLVISLSLYLSLHMVDYDLSMLIVPILIVSATIWREHQVKALYVFAVLLVYFGWSFDNYFLRNFESFYSAGIFTLWIGFLYCLTTGKIRLHPPEMSA